MRDTIAFERLGIPCVLVASSAFERQALYEASRHSVGHLRLVVVPHPFGSLTPPAVDDLAERIFDDVLDALTHAPRCATPLAERTAREPADFTDVHVTVDSIDDAAFQAIAAERGWSDGLPVLTPTLERVERMLATVDADPAMSLGFMPPSERRVTLQDIAANTVLAGSPPEAFPVVIASVVAALDPALNLESLQTTTHPVSTLILVNGPVRHELGYHAGGNAFGPGPGLNATTGRALRLCLLNIGGAKPPTVDRSTMGSPAKFTYCTAENEEDNPWTPLHVDRGFDEDQSVVTVFGGEPPHNVQDHVSSSAEGILYTAAGTVRGTGANNVYLSGEMMILLGPEHAATIAGSGWTKTDVQHFLYDVARNQLGDLKRGGAWGMTWWPKWYDALPDDHLIPVVPSPDHFLVSVVGGPGKHSACVPSFGPTRSVSREVRTTGLDAFVATQ